MPEPSYRGNAGIVNKKCTTTGWVCAMFIVGLSCASDAGSKAAHETGAAGAVANDDARTGMRGQADDTMPQTEDCHWPSELAAADSKTRDVCSAARAYLSCETDGHGVVCPSTDGKSCANPEIDSPLTNCKNNCEPNEYVAVCGGVGPGPVPEPPAGCRLNSANPGGYAIYCCSCE